jgi:hypothetical protein
LDTVSSELPQVGPMIALDTKVLVRHLVADDPEQ